MKKSEAVTSLSARRRDQYDARGARPRAAFLCKPLARQVPGGWECRFRGGLFCGFGEILPMAWGDMWAKFRRHQVMVGVMSRQQVITEEGREWS